MWTRLAAPVNKDRETAPVDEARAMYFARNRLDAVGAGEWDVTFETLPPRFSHNVTGEVSTKCRLQIMGVIRENVGTAGNYVDAYRIAFLGACVMFGIPCEPTGTDKAFDVPAVPFNE